MKQNKLLFCSALFVAPLCGLFASDADLASEKKSLAAAELRQEAVANLNNELDLSSILATVNNSATADFAAANPIAEVSIFKQMPNLMMARLKETSEPGVSESKATDSLEAVATQKNDGRTLSTSIVISNT